MSTSTTPSNRSTWFRIPPYLHRTTIPLLIGLTVVQLHSSPETRSPFLVAVFFCMALVGIALEKSLPLAIHGRAHPSTTNPHKNNIFTRCGGVESKLRLALSLTRATLYVFIGDAAAAQLLFLSTPLALDASRGLGVGSEAESEPLVFTRENWFQLGLAGCMWLLGALLWVMEPSIYWVSRWRENRGNRSCEKRGWLENGYFLLSQEDSDVETS